MAAAAGGMAVSYMASQVNNQNAAYENSIHQSNAKYLEQTADRVIERGNKEEQDFRNNVALMVGNQRVSMATAGIDVASGTALAIQQETANMGAADARTIKNNAYLEALGYRRQAQNERVAGVSKINQASERQFTSMATAGIAGMQASYSSNVASRNSLKKVGGA